MKLLGKKGCEEKAKVNGDENEGEMKTSTTPTLTPPQSAESSEHAPDEEQVTDDEEDDKLEQIETEERGVKATKDKASTAEKISNKLNELNIHGRTIYLARHGERLDFVNYEWRKTNAYPDDPPLTERGELQAEQLGERLKGLNITSVYASPFKRAIRTGTVAMNKFSDDIMINIEPGLCERLSNIRYWKTENGPLWEDLETLSKSNVGGYINNKSRINLNYTPVIPMDYNNTGYPESSTHIRNRICNVLLNLLRNDQSKGNILLIGHISSLKNMIHSLLPDTNIPLKIPYCCLTEFTPSDQHAWKCKLLCDNSFQSEIAKTKSSPQGKGYGRTKYLISMVKGAVYTTLKPAPSPSSPSSSIPAKDIS